MHLCIPEQVEAILTESLEETSLRRLEMGNLRPFVLDRDLETKSTYLRTGMPVIWV